MLDDLFEEISMIGIGFALFGMAVLLITKKWMLDPFLVHMGTGEGIFWMVATFLCTGVVGYFIGKKVVDDG